MRPGATNRDVESRVVETISEIRRSLETRKPARGGLRESDSRATLTQAVDTGLPAARARSRSSMGSHGGSDASRARCFAARSRARARLSPAALALWRAHAPSPISRRLPVGLVYRNTQAAFAPTQRSKSHPPSDSSLSCALSTSRADRRLSFAPSSRVAIPSPFPDPPLDPPETLALGRIQAVASCTLFQRGQLTSPDASMDYCTLMRRRCT